MIRLTYRERCLVAGSAVLVTAWILFVFGIRPTVERIDTLNRVIPEKQKALAELRAKSAYYLELQAQLTDYKKEAALEKDDFKPLAFLESLTREANLAKKVVTMRQEVLQLDSDYCEVIVEVKLESLTLEQLVEFLLETKSSKHFLRVKSLYARKNTTDSDLLDTVIQISALKPNKAI